MPPKRPASSHSCGTGFVPPRDEPRHLSGPTGDGEPPHNAGELAKVDGRSLAPVRGRVGRLFKLAGQDEEFAIALEGLAVAAHNYNRWEPSTVEFDTLCEAAEKYVARRRQFISRLYDELE